MALLKSNEPKGTIIEGSKVLEQKAGTILKVTSSPLFKELLNETIIKTNSDERPLASLSSGDLWYNKLDSLSFEIIYYSIELSN